MHVLMVAAENDALPNAEVGGVADVVRDAPKALAAQGVNVDNNTRLWFEHLRDYIGDVTVIFRGATTGIIVI
ncbi:glycogen/starch synthase (plasmid) [Pseudoalteromonas espejiana]